MAWDGITWNMATSPVSISNLEVQSMPCATGGRELFGWGEYLVTKFRTVKGIEGSIPPLCDLWHCSKLQNMSHKGSSLTLGTGIFQVSQCDTPGIWGKIQNDSHNQRGGVSLQISLSPPLDHSTTLPSKHETKPAFTLITWHALSFPVSVLPPVCSSPIPLPLVVWIYDCGSWGNSSADF